MTVKDKQPLVHKKLRVLCLHGYEQDSAIFRTKLRQHTDSLADIAEFVFVDAPNVMQPYDTSGVDNMARATAVRSGGLMAGVMCALLENRYEALGKKCTHPPFAFAIIASGYKLSDSEWTHLYERPLCTPSLHMYGILDSYINISKSIDLRRTFSQSAELSTYGGHFVPKSPEAIKTIFDFVAQFAA
ncbi:Ovarian cancer-associated protein 2 [Coemansia sp. RSA 720]|nr:Ovarian cancer-associated protein 2 [Coemansia sp. RSA 720]